MDTNYSNKVVNDNTLLGIESQSHRKKDINTEAKIKRAILQDPRLNDPSNISVFFERLGFLKGRALHIIGKVKDVKEKQIVVAIVSDQLKKKDKIVNELNVA